MLRKHHNLPNLESTLSLPPSRRRGRRGTVAVRWAAPTVRARTAGRQPLRRLSGPPSRSGEHKPLDNSKPKPQWKSPRDPKNVGSNPGD